MAEPSRVSSSQWLPKLDPQTVGAPSRNPPIDAATLQRRLERRQQDRNVMGNAVPMMNTQLPPPSEAPPSALLSAALESKSVTDEQVAVRRRELRMMLQNLVDSKPGTPITGLGMPPRGPASLLPPLSQPIGSTSNGFTAPPLGPLPASAADDAAYIEKQLYMNQNYLADLARLGVTVPPDLLPEGLKHLSTAPPMAATSGPSSSNAPSMMPPPPSSSSYSTSTSASSSSSSSSPQYPPGPVATVSAVEGVNPGFLLHPPLAMPLPVSPADVASGSARPHRDQMAMDDPRYMQYARPPPHATVQSMQQQQQQQQQKTLNRGPQDSLTDGQNKPSLVFVESKTTGEFKQVSGMWTDPTKGGLEDETEAQRVARLQRLQYNQNTMVYMSGTNTLQSTLAFALLLCAGVWGGLAFLQVYWGQSSASDAAFVSGYAAVANVVFVCNFTIGGVCTVLSLWFFYLEQWSEVPRFAVRDWGWQVHSNLVTFIAFAIGFWCTVGSAYIDGTLIHFYHVNPTWYSDATLYAQYSPRLHVWFRVNVVRFIVVIVGWFIIAYKFAFAHGVNPNLPLQAQQRGVRSVVLPEYVPLNHIAATIHVETHPRHYAHIFPHLAPPDVQLQMQQEQLQNASRGGPPPVKPIPGADNELGVRSVFAFV